jgi:hypothetical protein
VPIVRRNPSRELAPLLNIISEDAAGQKKGLRLTAELRQLGARRHESLGDSGSFEIQHAVNRAVGELEQARPPARR